MNLGILGAGRIAAVMADTVNKMNKAGDNSVKLYAVAAREMERAKAFASTNGIQKAFGSYEDMLCDSNLDFVYIATPHSHHYRHIKLCVNHGKHVLCEKAFTVNARQAEDILLYAKSKGVLVTEAIWTRYQPMRQMIGNVLSSGAIGNLKMLTANLCYTITDKERIVVPELAGGALLDVGVYTLNFAAMVFGHADGVRGMCTKNSKGVDISDSITLLWNDGRMAVLNASAEAVSDRSGIIYGDKGFVVVENINNPQGIKVYDRDYKLVDEQVCPPQLTGYEYEVAETVRCINDGVLECPSMPHEETIYLMETMDHLRAQMSIHYPCEGLDG